MPPPEPSPRPQAGFGNYLPSHTSLPVAPPPPADAAAASPPPGSVGSTAGSGTGSPAVTAGQQVEGEIRERLEECRAYERQKDEFGGRAKHPDYPVDRYRLIEPIGSGSFGSVWKATDLGDDERVVAIKFFPRGQGATRELVNEPNKLKQLTSEQGFVQLLDINVAAEWPYFVMTYAPRTLQHEIAGRGPLPAADAAWLFTRLVRAMAYAHAKKPGLSHCDLKPSNVLLADRGDGKTDGPAADRWSPLISDFGQSRLLDKQERAALGSLFFMPPDQAVVDKELPDSRWDVYALGAIAYQMLNPEKTPPRHEGWPQVGSALHTKTLPARLRLYREHLAKAPPPAAHHKAAGVDGRLAAIIDRCLDLDPEKRFRDAGAVLEALRGRAKARQRAPIIWNGLLATVVCFAVALAAGWYLQRKAVDVQKGNLTAQITAGQKESAYLAAQLLQDKLGQRVGFLERAANPGANGATAPAVPGSLRGARDEAHKALGRAVGILQENHGTPVGLLWTEEERKPVDDWLLRLSDTARKEHVFDQRGLFVAVNANQFAYMFSIVSPPRAADGAGLPGEWAVRPPWKSRAEVELFSRNFSYRDWFSGVGYDCNGEADKPVKPHPPLRQTHISVVYRSGSARGWLLVVGCPLFGKPTGAEPPPVVGVLMGATDVQTELTSWMNEFQAKTGADRDRHSDLVVVNDRGYLVWRRDMNALLGDQAAGTRLTPEEEQKVYARLQSYAGWEERFAEDRVPGQNGAEQLIHTFDDPWFDAHPDPRERHPTFIAQRQEFWPLGKGEGKKPWSVIIEQRRDTALRPVAEFQTTMWYQGMAVFGVFLTAASLLWGRVAWALRRTEGVVDA